ncbi:cysteine hydrolase [Luteimonas sp. BDR2-5]|uniref:cysteine hydrolase family protein n=1 Tax=Proluteimonas luteida TaxID=2878685 RepID=UPI001E4B20FC|nr:isochorismatase family cysteine hydrolase [Luteimonas sp. BDR2-5]MCD9027586.1 cysteine hydrolase [Luteimonas sp. BDR2-5]
MTDAPALLILDMISTFDFPRGDALRRAAIAAAPGIGRLKRRVRRGGGTCIYVNDNFTAWRSEFPALVALARESKAAPILDHLAPDADDDLVLKPRHSAFHQTPLQFILERTGIRRLLITGVSTEACVLATALDARMFAFDVVVVSDCVASSSPRRRSDALAVLRHCEFKVRRAAAALDAP